MSGNPIVANLSHCFFNHKRVWVGLTRAKALQAVSRFPRETCRRYAIAKSNAFTLDRRKVRVETNDSLCYWRG
jgi:hypothetical protein